MVRRLDTEERLMRKPRGDTWWTREKGYARLFRSEAEAVEEIVRIEGRGGVEVGTLYVEKLGELLGN